MYSTECTHVQSFLPRHHHWHHHVCQRENGDFLATKIIGIGIQQISETLKLEIVVLQICSTYLLLSIVFFAFRFKKTYLPILSHSPNLRSILWTWVKSWPRLSIGVAVHRCRLIVPNRRGVGLYSQWTVAQDESPVLGLAASDSPQHSPLTAHPPTQLSQGVALDLLSLFIVLTRISQAKVES